LMAGSSAPPSSSVKRRAIACSVGEAVMLSDSAKDLAAKRERLTVEDRCFGVPQHDVSVDPRTTLERAPL
jgi:hypothetical protein